MAQLTLSKGQLALWESLTQAITADRLPHALLFDGPDGSGKLDLAHALAQRLLCETPQTFACQQCRTCLLFHAGNHPDFIEVLPEAPGKPITIAQIRALSTQLTQTIHQSNARVIVLHPADAMNRASANALLKNLEEPGQRTYFILVTAQPHRLLATVRSRCQRFVFSASRESLAEEAEAEEVLDVLQSVLQGQETAVSAAKALEKIDNTQCLSCLRRLYDDAIFLHFDLPVSRARVPHLLSQSLSLPALYQGREEIIALQQKSQYHLNDTLQLEALLISLGA